MQARSPGSRASAGSLLACLLYALCCPASHAFNTITANVTVNSAILHSGCWDHPGCWKPDFFVAVYGTAGNTQSPLCKSATVVDRVNVGNPPPADWSCTLTVSRPGRIYIALYDGDGPNQDNTAGEQIDVGPGPEWSATVDLEALAAGLGAPSNFTSQGNHATITYSVGAVIDTATLNSFNASKTSFQPSAGEQIALTANAGGTPYTFMRVYGYNSAGAQVQSNFGYLDDPGEVEKVFVWQGRDPNGNPLPPGDYSFRVEGYDVTSGRRTSPPDLTIAKITIVPPPPVASLAITAIAPGTSWAPTVGDLTVTAVSSANATIAGEVWNSAACIGQKLVDLPAVSVQALRSGDLVWNGNDASGQPVVVGAYGIRVRGTAGTAPTSPASLCRAIDVVAASPATVVVQHAPFLATPGQTVELTAVSVDTSGALRIAGRLDVWASVQPISSPPTPPTAPLRTCTMAATCTASVVLPAGSSHLSWRGDAIDRAGTVIATSGWRGQRVTDPAIFAQWTDLAVAADVAFTGPLMADTGSEPNSFDLLLAVSTDFDWTHPNDRIAIQSGLELFMARLWGLSGLGAPAPTTFLSRPNLVRVYVTAERHLVSWTPAANLCSWTAPQVPWADAAAVLHKTSCRNSANPSSRTFSARLLDQDVILHELHHALFGLADEYPDGSGGYFEQQPFANIYNTMSGCTAVVGREPMGCTSITEVDRVSSMPTGRTFFRLDATLPDIMVENGPQRFADVQRAQWKERECDAGRC